MRECEGRRGNQAIWNYFETVDKEKKEAECKLCHNVYNYKTTSHNLKGHLKHKHNDVYLSLPASEGTPRKPIGSKDSRSSIWAYFEPEDAERKIASCNACTRTISYKTTTANLKTHLRRVHKELYAELEGEECEEVYLDDDGGEYCMTE